MATHATKGEGCTIELQALRRTHDAEDTAAARAAAQAEEAAAQAGDELEANHDPARPTASVTAALRANPVTANKTFLGTVRVPPFVVLSRPEGSLLRRSFRPFKAVVNHT